MSEEQEFKNTVFKVSTHIVITFSNEEQVELDILLPGSTQAYEARDYVTSIALQESLHAKNNHPAGIITANRLHVEIESLSGNLIPENEESPYFGLMNSSAILQITVTPQGEDAQGAIDFGTFYVDSWSSRIQADNNASITIDAFNGLSTLQQLPIAGDKIKMYADARTEFVNVLNAANSKLPDARKIQVLEPDDYSFRFNDIPLLHVSANTVGDYLNTFVQSFLTAIYIDRSNTIRTDYLPSAYKSYQKFSLSESENVTRANVNNGSFLNYGRISLAYPHYHLSENKEVASLQDQTIPGSGSAELSLQAKDLFKVSGVEIDSIGSSLNSDIRLTYTSTSIDATVTNSAEEDATVNIKVFGYQLEHLDLVMETDITNAIGSDILEVKNMLVNQNDLDDWLEDLEYIIKASARTLEIECWTSPHLAITDVIKVQLNNAMGQSGYYKVEAIDWAIDDEITAKVTCFKVADLTSEGGAQ